VIRNVGIVLAAEGGEKLGEMERKESKARLPPVADRESLLPLTLKGLKSRMLQVKVASLPMATETLAICPTNAGPPLTMEDPAKDRQSGEAFESMASVGVS